MSYTPTICTGLAFLSHVCTSLRVTPASVFFSIFWRIMLKNFRIEWARPFTTIKQTWTGQSIYDVATRSRSMAQRTNICQNGNDMNRSFAYKMSTQRWMIQTTKSVVAIRKRYIPNKCQMPDHFSLYYIAELFSVINELLWFRKCKTEIEYTHSKSVSVVDDILTYRI